MPLSIADAAAGIRSGAFSAEELTATTLSRIAALNEKLGAYVAVTSETALEAAATADRELAAGTDKGPLHGIPLAIKDIIATVDAPTTANSRILAPDWGKGIDAPVVARLRAAGAVTVGKATTMEFACGLPDADKGFLVPHNPWNVDHTPAGSSSGTGVAVVAGLAMGGLGTDTGGSVRGPASANGHTGLKVTFGRVPKSDVVPLGYTLDSVGPMARSAHDCALLLQVMAGYDASDFSSADVPVPDYLAGFTGSPEGVRIGVPMPYFFDAQGLEDEVRDSVLAAIEQLKDGGAIVTEVEIPYAKEAKEANSLTMVCEAYAYHRNNLVSRWNDYGQFTRPTIARGALFTGADYAQAQRFRMFFRREVGKVMSGLDVLVTPTSPTPAARADEMGVEKMILSPSFTGQWNFTGLPAVALPCGFAANGLPMSMQIVGKPFAEGTILALADAYQKLTDWHLQVPPVAVLEAV